MPGPPTTVQLTTEKLVYIFIFLLDKFGTKINQSHRTSEQTTINETQYSDVLEPSVAFM
jgi:hypothetical protein